MTTAIARLGFLVALMLSVLPARAQDADTVLLNGKIVTLDAAAGTQEALAVRDGKIVAVGNSFQIRRWPAPKTKVIDLGGRTVIPGLIDFAHARDPRRAVLCDRGELDRHRTPSRKRWSASASAARNAPSPANGSSSPAAGPSSSSAEKRRPTQAELLAAAPDNPVYIQLFYGAALLTPAGFKALNIASDADVPPRGKIERDADGRRPAGSTATTRPSAACSTSCRCRAFEQSVDGTRQFFRELNRLGLTGVSDPGGFNLTAPSYQPLFKVWRDGALTVRVVYSLFAQRRGKELEDYQNFTQMLPMGFGDDWLRFNGIGENVTWGMYNNDNPTDAQKEQLYQICQMGGVARHDAHAALEQRPSRCITCSTCWSASTGDADCAAALVDRASERRLAGEPRPHEGARRRLADAERDVFQRRGVPRDARPRGDAVARRRS